MKKTKQAARNNILKKGMGISMQGGTSVLQMTFVLIVKVLISSLITVWACTDIVIIQKRHGSVALSYIMLWKHSTYALMLALHMFHSLTH